MVGQYYELFRPLCGRVFGLDSLMGVGKSVTGKSMEHFLLEQGLPARYFPEFGNDRLLGSYLTNRQKYAFSFQSIMVMERLRIHRDAKEFADSGGIAIIDRTVYGDRAFESLGVKKGNITREDHETYLSLIADFEQSEKEHGDLAHYRIDLICYLNCDYDTCLRRLGRRGNKDEIKGYSKTDYVELEEEYLKSLSVVRDKMIVVDYSKELQLVYRDNQYYIPDSEVIALLLFILDELMARATKVRSLVEPTKMITLVPTDSVFSNKIDSML